MAADHTFNQQAYAGVPRDHSQQDKIIKAAADISNPGEESKSNFQFYAMTALAGALVGVAIGKKVWGKIVQ